MLTQLLELGLSIYYQNPSVFFVIMSSGIILLFALLMSNSFQRSETRITIIVVPIAVATYLLSLSLEGTEHDFFQNLSTEFIGGLLALVLFAEWITSNQYTFPVIALVIFGLAGLFVWQATLTTDGFYINLSTELLGALITTAVVRRDWLWSQADINEETLTERHSRFEAKRERLERETARRLCQLHLNIYGTSIYEIEKRQQVLSESVDIIYEGQITKRKGGGLQRTVYGNCKEVKMYPVDQESVMVIFDGQEQAIQKTTLRFSETFDVQETEIQARQLGFRRSQLRMLVKTPQQSFEQELHSMVDMFVVRWQDSIQHINRPSEAYVNGYHQAIEYVCQDLRTTVETI